MTGFHTKIFFVACRFTVAHALIYALPNLATFLRGHCNVKRHLYFAMFYFYSTPKMSQKQTSSHTSFFKTDKQSPRRKLVRNCEYQLTFDECTPLVVAAAAVSKKFPGRKKSISVSSFSFALSPKRTEQKLSSSFLHYIPYGRVTTDDECMRTRV